MSDGLSYCPGAARRLVFAAGWDGTQDRGLQDNQAGPQMASPGCECTLPMWPQMASCPAWSPRASAPSLVTQCRQQRGCGGSSETRESSSLERADSQHGGATTAVAVLLAFLSLCSVSLVLRSSLSHFPNGPVSGVSGWFTVCTARRPGDLVTSFPAGWGQLLSATPSRFLQQWLLEAQHFARQTALGLLSSGDSDSVRDFHVSPRTSAHTCTRAGSSLPPAFLPSLQLSCVFSLLCLRVCVCLQQCFYMKLLTLPLCALSVLGPTL